MLNLHKHRFSTDYTELISKDVLEISPIQYKMLNFIADNKRAVITAPRQCGKSTFIVMASILSNTNSHIITYTMHNKLFMYKLYLSFLNDNNISYKINNINKHIIINNKTIKFYSSVSFNANNVDICDNIYIDEYSYIDLDSLNISIFNKVVCIGTAPLISDKSYEYTKSGYFSGLNVR